MILERIESDRSWEDLFTETTEAQWKEMAAEVLREVGSGETTPLADFLNEEEECRHHNDF